MSIGIQALWSGCSALSPVSNPGLEPTVLQWLSPPRKLAAAGRQDWLLWLGGRWMPSTYLLESTVCAPSFTLHPCSVYNRLQLRNFRYIGLCSSSVSWSNRGLYLLLAGRYFFNISSSSERPKDYIVLLVHRKSHAYIMFDYTKEWWKFRKYPKYFLKEKGELWICPISWTKLASLHIHAKNPLFYYQEEISKDNLKIWKIQIEHKNDK